jgi:PKD repeat protein
MSTKAVKWHWEFGDNSSSNEQHPLHTYIEPGEYTITLFSENSLGCKDSISQKITVLRTTGLNEDLGKYIQVYPNPTPGKLTLKFTKGSLASNSVRIQLFSQLGKQVFDKSLQGAIHSLDFSHVSKGIYILKISSGNQQLLKKIILH